MENENVNVNRFIEKGVEINFLSDKDKEIIEELPYIDYTYFCKNCKLIPRIAIEYNKDKEFRRDFFKDKSYIIKIRCVECDYTSTFKMYENDNETDSDLFGLEKILLDKFRKENHMNIHHKKKQNNENSLNLLNFENINYLNEYLNVYKSYLNI